ncbi:TPA: hypothetical protein ACH3X1_012368 [Trebouxia sp. C0004]
MMQTRSQERGVFKLDVRSQKDQGIFKNTSNSLTGASASSTGAKHYATTLPPVGTQQPNAYGTPQSPRHHEGRPQVKVCSWCFQGSSEKRCIGQDEERRRQEEEPQETPCAQPQAQVRDHHAQKDSILHEIIPQVIRHVDCQLYFNIMWNRYKAVIYLNGEKVQEMFDFSMQELKERLRKRVDELDATSHTPLTKAMLWTTEPSAWDCASETVQIQATHAKDPVSDS